MNLKACVGKKQRSGRWSHNQCDQIGQFLEVLGNNSSFKSSPNVWDNLENHIFLSQLEVVSFWATFEKIGQIFIPASGHTAHNPQSPAGRERKPLKIVKLIIGPLD